MTIQKELKYVFKYGNDKYDFKKENPILRGSEYKSFLMRNPAPLSGIESFKVYFRDKGEGEVNEAKKNIPLEEIKDFLDYQYANTKAPINFLVILKYDFVHNLKPSPAEYKKHLEWIREKEKSLYTEQLPKHIKDKADEILILELSSSKIQQIEQKLEKAIEDIIALNNINYPTSFLNYFRDSIKERLVIHEPYCEDSYNCQYNSFCNRLIDICDKWSEEISSIPKKQNSRSTNPQSEFTLARQILAIYYLTYYSGVNFSHINHTDFARFAQLLTGREATNKKIANTSIYQKCRGILTKSDKLNVQDLKFIKPYFEKVQLNEVVKMIDNDLASYNEEEDK